MRRRQPLRSGRESGMYSSAMRLTAFRAILSIVWLLAACRPLPAGVPSTPTPGACDTLTACMPGEQALAGYPPAGDAGQDAIAYPGATAVIWAGGYLWTANESGLLTRWDVRDSSYKQYYLPDRPVIRALADGHRVLWAGTDGGDIWELSSDGWRSQRACDDAPVAAITEDETGTVWCACPGEGLIALTTVGGGYERHRIAVDGARADAVREVSALVFEAGAAVLWIATRSGELLSYYGRDDEWRDYVTLRDGPAIGQLRVGADGWVWMATSSGIQVYQNGAVFPCCVDPLQPDVEALSLAVAVDRTLWVTGSDYVACVRADGTRQVFADADNPVLSDRHRFVVLDDAGYPWFVGRRGKVRFDGQTWTAIDADVRRLAPFVPVEPARASVPPPREFPSPARDHDAWLQAWPRPANDNGLGMHFLQTHQYDAIEVQRQVNRLKQLGVRWALVQYADHAQLVRTAPLFQAAGITVVWRPFVRPYQAYVSWAEDVAFLRNRGIAPYMQLYNEPSLEQEGDGICPVSRETYLQHLLPAVRQVYDAGGYVGLQLIDLDWLRFTLREMKMRGASDPFERLFFVPHLHGLNHPPEYTGDINGVLGFREFAQVFQEEIGFVPVMIAGEGGWRPGEQQDNRFPAITEELHCAYHVAVFDWFRTGRLSNGDVLPDYLFAFCPWLISDPADPAAWFDSVAGDRYLTIETIVSTPAFVRKFSWDG